MQIVRHCGSRDPRQPGVGIRIAVPVLLRNHVGIVRVRHRHHQAERAVIPAARDVEELLARRMDDFVVVVDLVGAHAGAGLRDRIHRVIPAGALIEAGPVWRPAEISRIDIGRQALLETVQLIRAAEMHLAAQGSLVAGAAQVMSEGRRLRWKFGGVVVGTDLRWQLPGHEREPRGGAQRAVAVAGIEHDAVLRQSVDMRCPGAAAVGRQYTYSQLIGHEQQKIRRH